MIRDFLNVEGITKEFVSGMRAVDGVSLQVHEGKTLAIIGPNGAGKSTLFGLIAGEHAPTEGHIVYQGQDMTRTSASHRARAGISRTFQVARIFTSLSVRDNLLLATNGVRRNRVRMWDRFGGRRSVEEQVGRHLESLQLMGEWNRTAGLLPQGDRKRLELAMALIQQPKLLLLDEPTAGMATEDAVRTTALLQDFHQEHPEVTTVLTAHDMAVVFSLADRVVLLAGGQLAVEGSPEEVRSNPLTKSIYLGSEG